MLLDGNSNYIECYKELKEILNLNIDKEVKTTKLIELYKEHFGEELSKILLYLLDQPQALEHHEILKGAYEEISKE